MNWLTAALAFAITMLALSTVVTTTVETIHRILGLREDGLRSMLQHLYDAAIAPHVDRAFPNGGPDRDEFLQCMTTNRAPAGDAGLPAAAAPRLDATDDRRFLSWIWGGRRLGSLSVDDFMARLGASRFGDAVAQLETDVGPTAVDAVVQDIAHKFESFGRDASEYFQARARLVSVLVAMVIAWQCYVNPLLLAQTFLGDPKVTAKVIDMSEQYVAASKAPDQQRTPEAGRDQRSATDDAKHIPEKIDELLRLGVPIGWTAERLSSNFQYGPLWVVYPVSRQALPTIAWLLLGGLLIGLGSPFWRDAVLSLTAFRDRSQKAADAAKAIGRDPLVLAAERFVTASQARGATQTASRDDETDVAVG